MREQLQELAELRKRVAEIKSIQNQIYDEAVTNNPEYQELANKKALAETRMAELEQNLKMWTLTQFAQTGSKKPMSKLSVRENTKVEYDPSKAIEWARVNLPDAFEFNPKVFEKYVTTVKCPDFATIRKVPSASVGEDLTEYLPTESDEL